MPTTIARAEMFDQMVAAYDWAHTAGLWPPATVERAFDWLIQQETYTLDRGGALLIPSESRPGVVYRVWMLCSCPAPRGCWHLAAADIIGRARRALLDLPFAARFERVNARRSADELVADLF